MLTQICIFGVTPSASTHGKNRVWQQPQSISPFRTNAIAPRSRATSGIEIKISAFGSHVETSDLGFTMIMLRLQRRGCCRSNISERFKKEIIIKESSSYLFREQLKKGPLIIGNALALMTYLKCRDRCKSVFETLLSTQHQHRGAEFGLSETCGNTFQMH